MISSKRHRGAAFPVMGWLSHFQSTPTRFRISQEDAFAWIEAAHVRAQSIVRSESSDLFRAEIKQALKRYGCSADKIAERGHELGDFTHQNWNEMTVFRLNEVAAGLGLEKRSQFFSERALAAFHRLYPEDEVMAPRDLLHVTCTGYVSPSAPQVFLAQKGWHDRVQLLQIYHHGCYASLPAVRTASALVQAGTPERQRADIVHTELCSLHFNPSLHSAEQLVVQSLFADGFIRYRVEAQAPAGGSLALLTVAERILPETAKDMQWIASDWGFRMVLSSHVPLRLARMVGSFVEELFKRAGLDPKEESRRAFFAIHPGGPRILEGLEDILKLERWQTAASHEVLREKGNMSSATLPFVWDKLLQSDSVEAGNYIVSLGFGPGLTIAGALFRKAVSA